MSPGTIGAGGRIVEDRFVTVVDEAGLSAVSPDQPVIVSRALFGVQREALLARPAPLGLLLLGTDDPADVVDDLTRFEVVAIDFPKFTDGRGYSHARTLRQRLDYHGELRAAGNVLRDQYLFMDRCGIDSIEIADEAKVAGYLDSLGEFSIWYQPAADQRPPVLSRRHARRQDR